MNVLAASTGTGKFIWIDVSNPGSVNDNLATRASGMFARLYETGKYFLLGDAAFPPTPQLIVPFAGKNLDAEKAAFNFHQSSFRMCIERAFGMWRRRFPIFKRPLEVKAAKVGILVRASMRLHNLMIDAGDYDEGWYRGEIDEDEPAEAQEVDEDELAEEQPAAGSPAEARRDALKDAIVAEFGTEVALAPQYQDLQAIVNA